MHDVIVGEFDGNLSENEIIKMFSDKSNIKIIVYFEIAIVFLIIILKYVENYLIT